MFKSFVNTLNSISFFNLFILFIFSALCLITSLILFEDNLKKKSTTCIYVDDISTDNQKIKTKICYNNETLTGTREVQQ